MEWKSFESNGTYLKMKQRLNHRLLIYLEELKLNINQSKKKNKNSLWKCKKKTIIGTKLVKNNKNNGK